MLLRLLMVLMLHPHTFMPLTIVNSSLNKMVLWNLKKQKNGTLLLEKVIILQEMDQRSALSLLVHFVVYKSLLVLIKLLDATQIHQF